MDIALGNKRKVSVATEESLGTKEVSSMRSAIIQTEALSKNVAPVEDPGIFGNVPFEIKRIAGPADITGTIGDATLYTEGAFPLILLHAMGSVSSAQQGSTAAYQHSYTFVNDTDYGNTKGLTISVERDVSNPFDFYGCVVNQLTIKWAHGQVVSWAAEILGIGSETGSSPTLSIPSMNPLVHGGVALVIDDTTTVPTMDGQIVIANNFKADYWNGNARVGFPRNGFAGVTGSFTKPVVEAADEADYYNKFINHTSLALVITMTGSTITAPYSHNLVITIPRVFINDMGAFASGGKENPNLPVNFKALATTVGGMAISASIISTEISVA